ncbi:ABC transporter ATP-binding protein [Tepidamorphus sp. 3E244]|uniref:ABC transporter ATP-binding protein n=1 Tax=Tepidamorphus sp. 3E244 TaxID=3385498 RepID=UPI0038FCAC90
MLELRNVSKVVGEDTHIDDVSLMLTAGSLNVLLGPTLAGKTTLMRLMAGLEQPTSGQVLVNGTDVTGWPVQKRNVAMVYQQFINYPTLSVYENIASPLRVARVAKDEIDARVRKAADLMQLGPYLDRTPLNLSGGQQQRTALARALVKGAELVLLDEPLANLDYKLREELRAELPRIFAESGAVFVYATTEPSEALLLGGNTATLHHGAVTQFGPTIEVYRNPVDLTTARTFSDPPINTAKVEKSGATLSFADAAGGASVPAGSDLPDGTYTVAFQPHHLLRRDPGRGALKFTGTVAVTEITGSESFIHLDVGDARWVSLVHGVHNHPVGETIDVWVDPARFMFFSADGDLARPAEQPAAA